jgi:alpha-beta hydrolase superfamily lysophospholipase
MAFELVMPKWGLSMQEGLINYWLKQEGDHVKKGEPLLEVETEKITNVVEAPESGILARILFPAGSTVPVSEVIALITAPGEPLPDLPPTPASTPGVSAAALPGVSAAASATATASARGPAVAPEPTRTPTPTAAPGSIGIIPATPAARRLAREHGLDLAKIRSSAPGGTITKEDVERALAGPPAPAPRVQPAAPRVQKVTFYSDGWRLDGLVYTPEGLGAGERRAAVVLCPGYTYLKTLVMPDIAKALNAAGYVAFLFDYRGFGDSDGPRWRLIPSEQVADVRAALTFLADQAPVDPERLAVLGVSLGGSNAVAAGAVDRRVGAVVAIEPVGDGERWLRGLRRHWEWLDFQARLTAERSVRVRTGQSTRVHPLDIVVPDPDSRAFLDAAYREFPQMKCELPLESAEALVEFRPDAMIEQLAPRPVLLIHGAADRLVPAEESQRLFARAGEPRRLEIVPGLGHFDWVMPNTPGFRRVIDLAVDFLREVFPARS